MPSLEPPVEPRRRALLLLRGLVFAVLGAFLMGGPLLRQGLGLRNPYLPQWVMFVGYGLDVCAVRYAQRGDDGALQTLDRFALLGHPDWASAPRSVKRVSDLQGGERLGRQLCGALGAGADVRMSLRCAARTGWTTVAADETDLCRRAAKPRPGRPEAGP